MTEGILTWLKSQGVDFAMDVLAAAIILIVGAVVIRFMTHLLRLVLERKIGERTLLVRFLLSVSVKCAWILLIVLVLEKLGVAVGPLVAGLGVTGFILGFAFQESLGSLAAGVMIAFNQPFKVGDTVIVAGHEGTVQKLDMMSVVLMTKDNRRVTIPNKQAWGGVIVNCSPVA